MAKFTATSADWTKKISFNSPLDYEEVIFEVATKAVEWALRRRKEVGLFVEVEDERVIDKNFCVLSYRVLCNAGYHTLAEAQRQGVKEEYEIDLAENIEIGQLINRLNKAAEKKVYCIAEMIETPFEEKKRKTAMVCIKLGLFEDIKLAKAKCKELNVCVKSKQFVVKKMSFNNFN